MLVNDRTLSWFAKHICSTTMSYKIFLLNSINVVSIAQFTGRVTELRQKNRPRTASVPSAQASSEAKTSWNAIGPLANNIIKIGAHPEICLTDRSSGLSAQVAQEISHLPFSLSLSLSLSLSSLNSQDLLEKALQ